MNKVLEQQENLFIMKELQKMSLKSSIIKVFKKIFFRSKGNHKKNSIKSKDRKFKTYRI